MFPGLTPPPDAHGEPRPPAAPRVTGPWRGRYGVNSGHFAAADERWVARMTGKDRLLETVFARRPDRWRYSAKAAFVCVVPVAVVMLILMVVQGAPREAYVILGEVVAGGWLLYALIHGLFHDRHIALEAGPRTLAEVDVSGSIEVPLFELDAVRVVNRARLGLCLRLAKSNSSLVVPLGLLEGNQRLWDLVYHGVRHSVAAGAETDERTRRLLGLSGKTPAEQS